MKTVLWLIGVLGLGAIASFAQPNKPARLAVIAPEPALRSAVDLLTTELSHLDQIALLERAEIERVLHEQTLATAGKDWLKLGQVLGADGLLIAGSSKEGTNQFLGVRLVAVKPGVILGAVRSTWPLTDVAQWAKWIPGHFAPLFSKLSVLPKQAVPISVVNLRAAVSTKETRELEQQLTLLAIERLTRERELFVLERRQMELLSVESELRGLDDAVFWNGRYLLDGVIDRDGYSKDRLTIHARLMPPAGGAAQEITIEGPRSDIPAAVEKLAAKILAVVRPGGEMSPWKVEAEAARYFDESKWAMRWGMFRQAQAAVESAWALGLRSASVAELRVRECRETGTDPEGCYIARETGWITFTAPPDAGRFVDAVRAAEIYDAAWLAYHAGAPKLERKWFELGLALVEDLGNWLRHYYFTVEARAGMEEKINAAQQLSARILAGLSQHNAYAETDPGRSLLAVASHVAAFWFPTPEEGLAFHRRVLAAGDWRWVRRRFLYVGRFPVENNVVTETIGSTSYSDPANPPLAGWTWTARARWPEVWRNFLEELCAAKDPLVRLEGHYLRCSYAWSGEEFERRLAELLGVVLENREAILRAQLQANLLADLRALVGLEQLDTIGFISQRTKSLSPERAERITYKLWRPFEEQFTQRVRDGGVNEEFEKVRAYFQTRRDLDPALFTAFLNREYNVEQAKELLPLVAAYRTRILEDKNPPATPRAELHRENLPLWTQKLEAKLRAKLTSPVSNSVPVATDGRSLQPNREPLLPRPPVTVPGASQEASNSLAMAKPAPFRVDRFWSARSIGLEFENVFDFSVTDTCWREGRLWVQLRYVEADASGNRTEQCFVCAIEPASFKTESYSLRDQLPANEGGYLQVSVRQRLFEVVGKNLFISTGRGLKKCDLGSRRWENLSVPVEGDVRLYRIADRLLASTSDSILELSPDGATMKILASSRRQPPVTLLDQVPGYGTPPLFSLGHGDIKAYVRGKIYSLASGSPDWVVTATGPPVSSGAVQAVESALFLQRSAGPGSRELWGMFAGNDTLELLAVQTSPQPAGPGRLPPRFGTVSTNSPKWKLSPELPPLGTQICSDGSNVWVFCGRLAFEAKDGRAMFKVMPGGNALLSLAVGETQPQLLPLEFESPSDQLPPRLLNGIVGDGAFGDYVFRFTPAGLMLTRSGVLGCWLMPREKLERAMVKQ